MDVTATTPLKDSPYYAGQDATGFNAITAESFMKLLITQLQNQDPSQPVGNEELLNQLALMRNIQSNVELIDSMKAITSGQQLSTAASFIGKHITGTGAQGAVSGVVDRVLLKGGAVYVAVGDQELKPSQIESVVAGDS